MKITRILYALMGLFLCISLQTGCTGKTATEESFLAKPKTLASATDLINDRCPVQVDPDTRLDSVVLSREGKLIYYYTLPDRKGSSINPSAFNAYLLPEIIDNVRSNRELRMHRDSSVTMVFNYRDQAGELITEFSVGPEMYH